MEQDYAILNLGIIGTKFINYNDITYFTLIYQLKCPYQLENVNVSMRAKSLQSDLTVTLWTVAHYSPLCMEFSRQEYWSGLLCHPPGDLPDPGTEPMSPAALALQADSLPLSHWGSQSIKSKVPQVRKIKPQ